jgi:Domain of unknown function (DUF5753)
MNPDLPEWALTPKQQFGQHLRSLREASSQLSMGIARQIGISSDLASRVELGERWLKPELVEAWGRATGQSDEQIRDLVELLAEKQSLESRLRSEAQKPKLVQDVRSKLFQRAARIRTFATTEIPFYLQTMEYARRDVGDAAGAADVVSMRRADNEAVGSKGKDFEILLAESALRYFPCDTRTMRGQLSDLQRLVEAPGVEIGIVPFGTQATPLRSGFSIFDEITVVESFAGAIDLTPKSAKRYIALMDRLWDDAVRGADVRELLTAAASALPAS